MIAVLTALVFSASAAFSVDYSGKTVTIWVPFKAGGGTDAVARALTAPLSANLPGNPAVVVKNMTEGGGIGSVNTYVAKHGKDKDGLVVLATSGSTQLQIYNLGSDNTGATLVTTLTKIKPKAKSKLKNRVNSVIVDKSKYNYYIL